MYKIGELILYGRTGVCKVDAITEVQSGDAAPQKYYTLTPLYQSCSIRIPVGSGKVFSRPIISGKEAQALIDRMPEMAAAPYYNRNLNQLREHYRACMESHDCEDLVAMAKSLYLKKKETEAGKRKFGAVDERFMKEAEDLLFGEFAAALGIERDAVEQHIAKSLGRD